MTIKSTELILGDGVGIDDILDSINNFDHVHQIEDFEPEDLKEILTTAPDWKKIRITIEELE